MTIKGTLAALLVLTVAACKTVPTATPIPFEVNHGILLIEADIGESSSHVFMVDTGVDPSGIDLATARILGLPIDESAVSEAAGAGDGQGLAIMPSLIENLSVVGRNYGDIDAVTLDMTGFGEVLETDLAGILGYSLLQNRILRIDYAANEMFIVDSRDALPPTTTRTTQKYTIPLRSNSDGDPIPVFDIMVDGESVTVSLDTGKSGGIGFFKPAVDRLGLEEITDGGQEQQRLGARGQHTVITGMLEKVMLGPFEVLNVESSVSDKIPMNELREGNVGNGFLKSFVLTVDYRNREIVFER